MNKTLLIIEREYKQRVKKRSFIFTTLLIPLFIIGIGAAPALMSNMGSGTEPVRDVVVVDPSGVVAPSLYDTPQINFVPDTTPYPDVVAAHPESFGFLLVGDSIVDNPSALKFYTRSGSTINLENDIRNQIRSIIRTKRIQRLGMPELDSIIGTLYANVELNTFTIEEKISAEQGGEQSSSAGIAMMIAYGAGFMIYMFIFLYGGQVMQGIVEEKSSRVIEVIVSSVRPVQLMMGKIIGVALVSLTQLAIWIVLVSVGFNILEMVSENVGGGMAQALSSLSGMFAPGYLAGLVVCFVLLFIGGYLLYASMFAAIASGVDNIADTQQLQLPVTMPLILSIIILLNVLQNPGSPMAFWFSIIPFTSPIVMMARLPYGVPTWEIILALVLLYATFVATTYLAARIYRTGIFMYGKKPTLREIIRWVRYK